MARAALCMPARLWAERQRHQQWMRAALREEVNKMSIFEEIVGTSPALRALLSQISKLAATDSTVLISRESTSDPFVWRARS
jgi:formate hydrogenlyase transcriptional activator